MSVNFSSAFVGLLVALGQTPSRTTIGVAALLLLTGCASRRPPTTAAGQPVRLTSNAATVEGCKFLGNVAGRSAWGGLAMQSYAEDAATNAMLLQAAELGADTVLLSTSNVKFSGSTMRGEAYLCRETATPPP